MEAGAREAIQHYKINVRYPYARMQQLECSLIPRPLCSEWKLHVLIDKKIPQIWYMQEWEDAMIIHDTLHHVYHTSDYFLCE